MRRFAVLAAVVLTAGCMSTGVVLPPDAAAQFKKGETTEADVVKALGAPTQVSQMNGSRYVSYSGMTGSPRAASFIPIIGPLVGGADIRASMVQFVFGPDGKLVDTSTHHSQYGSATGIAAGASDPAVADQPRK